MMIMKFLNYILMREMKTLIKTMILKMRNISLIKIKLMSKKIKKLMIKIKMKKK